MTQKSLYRMPKETTPPAASRNELILFWGLLALGLALRLIWVAFVPMEPVSDSAAYATFAQNIVAYGVYGWGPDEPSAYWPVGPAAIAALSLWLLGDLAPGVIVANLISGMLSLVLVYRLGVIWFDRRVALMALAIMAIWPNLILFTTVLASELHFIALTLLGLWLWERRSAGWSSLVLCGLAWGAACYMRPVVLLVPVVMVLAMLPGGLWATARAAGRAVLVTVVMLATVLPWSVRNHQVFGEFVLMSTNFGPNLWMGHNPDSTGGYMPLPPWVAGMSETERAEVLGNAAREFIREDPLRFAVRTAVKLVRLHERETIGVHWNRPALERMVGDTGFTALRLLSTGYWTVVLLAALAGIVLLLRREPLQGLVAPVLLLWGYFALLHAVTVIQDRYHMPSVPFIALLAALALLALWDRRHRAAEGPGHTADVV